MKKGQSPLIRWKSDIIDWTNVSKETGNLFISQCEKALSETVETSTIISSKADKVLTIIIPIITAVAIYVFNGFVSDRKMDAPLISASLILIPLVISLIFVYRNFVKYNVFVPGIFPNKIVISNFIDNGFNSEQQYSNIVIWICEGIQAGIDGNKIVNAKRMRNNTLAIRSLLFIPLCPVAGYFLFQVLANYYVLP